jgi:hypothetical protein
VPAWWLNGRILRKKTFALGQIRILNFLTPIFRILDPVTPLPPLSLIAILHKESASAQPIQKTAPSGVFEDVDQ